MPSNDYLIGLATQDHELAGIRDRWKQTDPRTQDEFIAWLEGDDEKEIKEVFAEMPMQWITWIQKCAACGLRQAVLEEELPELTVAELAAMDSLPADSVKHWLQGEWWNGQKWIPYKSSEAEKPRVNNALRNLS